MTSRPHASSARRPHAGPAVKLFVLPILAALAGPAVAGGHDDDFDAVMGRVSSHVSAGEHAEALALLEKAEALLPRDPDEGIEQRAWVLDYRRYALYELGRIDEALATCREAIDVIGNHTIWPYLREHDILRRTLRGAHNMLAWVILDRASTRDHAREALAHIERCFEVTSPIEDEGTMDPFHATRALVHLRFAKDDASHRRIAYESLCRLREIGSSEIESEPALREAAASRDFAAHCRGLSDN